MIMVTGGRVGADDHGGRVPFQMPEFLFQMPELPFQMPELSFQMR
jgi:hypothetical protein